MGVLMGFYASEPGRSAAALEEDAEFDLASADFVRGTADFSLHIASDTLDEMVTAACEAKGMRRFGWDEAQIAGLGESAAKMSPAFIELFSALGTEELVAAARPWMGDTLTPDLENAMGELITLCQLAKRDGLEVVFCSSA